MRASWRGCKAQDVTLRQEERDHFGANLALKNQVASNLHTARSSMTVIVQGFASRRLPSNTLDKQYHSELLKLNTHPRARNRTRDDQCLLLSALYKKRKGLFRIAIGLRRSEKVSTSLWQLPKSQSPFPNCSGDGDRLAGQTCETNSQARSMFLYGSASGMTVVLMDFGLASPSWITTVWIWSDTIRLTHSLH